MLGSRKSVKWLGSCLIEEALWLHQAGIKSNILVFPSGFDKQGAEEIIERGFIPVVSQWDHLEFLTQTNKSKAVSIHVKFDTGMNRLGFPLKRPRKLMNIYGRIKTFV